MDKDAANTSPMTPGQIELMQGLADLIASDRRYHEKQQSAIDPEIYTSTARFEDEFRKVIQKCPIPVGHENQIAEKGAGFVFDHLGLPLIIIRGADEKVRGFLNVCRHRNVRLVQPDKLIRIPSFICPYHNWTYGLDGTLKHVPLEDGFMELDKCARGLVPVPVEVRHGLIWVKAEPNGSMDLGSYLAGIGADLDALNIPQQHFFRQSIITRKTNWKLVIDAFLDSYHVKRLHRNTVGPYFADSLATLAQEGLHLRAAVAREEFGEHYKNPPETWHPRLHVTFAYTIFPCTVIICHPDYTSLLNILPQDPDTSVIIHSMITDEIPETDKAKEHWKQIL